MAPRGDDIDLAEWAFPAPRQDPIAVRDQPGGGAALGRDAKTEGRNFFWTRLALLPLRARRLLGRPRRAVTRRHHCDLWRVRARSDRPRDADDRWQARLRRPRL